MRVLSSKKLMGCVGVAAFFLLSQEVPDVRAHAEVTLDQLGAQEGDMVRAAGISDPDIYIVNQYAYRRLFLSPRVLSFYGHLRWENVRNADNYYLNFAEISQLFRNCEADDPKVYALEVIAEDTGALHWVDMTAEAALAEDHDFFDKVFCINTAEFSWYARGSSYTSVAQIPAYSRANLPPPAINETDIPLVLPDGYRFSLFTPNAVGPLRFMAFSPDNILFVSMPASAGLYSPNRVDDGKIFALPDRNNDGRADETKTVLSNLHIPHGIAFYNGYLYAAEEDKISRYPYLGDANVGAREVVVSGLPAGGGGHVSRTLGFGSNGKMYVSIGSSCNVCVEQDERRASIMEFNPDGSGGRVFASGLRNAVGFVFHPTTGEIWATENGRDYLGDDLPPDEINIVRDGKNYGWPYCYGKNIHDTDFDKNFYIAIYPPLPCGTADEPIKEPSLFDLQAHVAPLGLRFIESAQFPDAWQGDLLVALHGSWNRTVPVGYSVVRLDVEGPSTGSGYTILGAHDFITGWLRPDGSKAGRPVDIVFGPDGALYISDDKANVIYRVTRI